jgi:predicted neuraminidase
MRKILFGLIAIAVTAAPALVWAEEGNAPSYTSMLVEPLNKQHNHGSCVVEVSSGDVLVSWYKGSGERTADDVKIVGARLAKGGEQFSEVFDLADFKGFPDCNSSMLLDKQGKLWLFWPLIVANQWETAILMSRSSTDYLKPGAPCWTWQSPILLEPGEPFAKDLTGFVDGLKAVLPKELFERYADEIAELKEKAADKYARRSGWMPRAHGTVLPSGRIILPLYSDGYSVSLMAISDDEGETWTASRPILSIGGVQPSVVWKDDGTLAAFMRDNGPPPKRVIYSESKDNGMTWSLAIDHELLDSGAGVQADRLANGHWIVIHNDLENGRHSLAVHLSDDEGKTWKWVRHLERFEKDQGAGSYPSAFQGADGLIHATYSFNSQAAGPGESIKYARFNEAWIMEGDK